MLRISDIMPDVSSLSHYPLKVLFAIHLILTTWATQGGWCPQSVMYYNVLFLISLMWAVHNAESDEPIQFALCINVVSVFLDIITLSIYFPSASHFYATDRFGAAMMIINLLVRLASTIGLLRIGQSRGGSLATLFPPGPGMDYARQQYEDISYPVPQNNDFSGI